MRGIDRLGVVLLAAGLVWCMPGCGPQRTHDGPFEQLSVGSGYVCALDELGQLACWDTWADLEDVEPAGIFQQVSCEDTTCCALDGEGNTTCWGEDDMGIFDSPDTEFSQISVASGFACGLTEFGELECWGDEKPDPPTPTLTQFSTSHWRSCGVTTQGDVVCWETGEEFFEGDFVAVSAGWQQHCAIDSQQRLECHVESYQDPSMRTAGCVQVSVGTDFSCALYDDDAVECWGEEADHTVPPDGLYQFVDAGSMDACAIDLYGDAICWGFTYRD